MLTAEFNFSLLSKPRGKQARNGHIYHSTASYLNYKKRVLSRLSGLPEATIQVPYATGLLFGLSPKAGKTPDACDNVIGSVLDTLVENQIVKDDSAEYWQGNYVRVIKTTIPYSFFCLTTVHQLHQIVSQVNYQYNNVRSNIQLFDKDRHEKSYRVSVAK